MNNKTILIFILAFLLLTSLQCNKDSTVPLFPNLFSHSKPDMILPPITTKGLNTIGCKIDGEVWVPYSEDVSWTGIGMSPIYLYCAINRNANWKLELYGQQVDYNSPDEKNNIQISVSPLNTDTVFTLTKNRDINVAYFTPVITDYDPSKPNNSYAVFKTDEALNNGSVHILLFDSIKQIISGTFSFTVIDSITKIKHEITEGRFDLRYAY